MRGEEGRVCYSFLRGLSEIRFGLGELLGDVGEVYETKRERRREKGKVVNKECGKSKAGEKRGQYEGGRDFA